MLDRSRKTSERNPFMRTEPGRIIRRLLAAAALLLGIAAAALTMPGTATAASTADVPGPKTLVANRVELVRTGGFTGIPQTWVVDAEHFGEDGARLLRLVSTPDYLALRPLYGTKNPCCDFFIYTVTVTYDGGFTKVVRTSELATDEPELLTKVIALTQLIGESPKS
jgi:hypothetical protein